MCDLATFYAYQNIKWEAISRPICFVWGSRHIKDSGIPKMYCSGQS